VKSRIVLVLCSLLVLAGALTFAQTKPAATPAPQQQQSQPAQAAPTPESPQHELVETSKGAEEGKEEDEEAQFKYSPSVKWLAAHLHMSKEGAYWLFLGINFAIVLGFILWAVKKYAPSAFRDRTAMIKRQLEEARAASEDANRRLSEIEGRLAKLDSEISEMRTAADQDSASEEQRLKAAAEDDKKKIVSSAEQEIASAAKMARAELKKYTAELAVALAEKKIQVTPQTDQALVRNFTDHLNDGGKS
jgi:F-type H+-transporting ATPase subunit b